MTAPTYVLDLLDAKLDADLLLCAVTDAIAERHGWNGWLTDAYQADIEAFMSAIAACNGDPVAEFVVCAVNLIMLNHKKDIIR